ncbi:MAG: rRNA maturation RNase YbeY [Candidatus Acidiferrum sp.]|jgi:rRNA maturation RNase YbeY
MILNRQRTVRVARPPLELFLRRVREQLGLNGAGVTVCLVSDAEIARMNQSFRKKKGPTDVLSFPAETRRRGVLPRRRALRQRTGSQVAENARESSLPGLKPVLSRRSTSELKLRPSKEMTFSEACLAVPKRTTGQRASAPEGDSDFLGDIAISPATARRNAKKYHRTLPSELQILILHGVLHLLGYDHETDRGQMTRIENELRRKLGLS